MKRTGKQCCTGLAAAAAAAVIAMPAAAETVAELSARVAALESKADAQQKQPLTVSGGGYGLTFYGFVKGDAVYDNNYDLGYTTGGFIGMGTASGAKEGSASHIHAYESRLGIKGLLATDAGDVKFNLEGDFYGGGGGTFRLRHAYGEWGSLLVGQTWNLWNPQGFVPSRHLDFNGLASSSHYRTPQIRYTHKFSDTVTGMIGLEEDPSSNAKRVAPAFQIAYNGPQFGFGFGGVHRQLERPDALGGGTTNGYAVSAAASYKWSSGQVGVQYGQSKAGTTFKANAGGAGWSPITDPSRTFFDLDANGEGVKAHGYKFAITQKLPRESDISFSYGTTILDEFAGFRADDTEQLEGAFLTLRHFPTKSVMVGVEAGFFKRTEFDGDSFDNTRLQTSVQFTF
ncbi:DcaP family trimeric outer membrane transporter [Paracoccus sp. J55]|uniref:DcaP family trimeric outer membrane transporter n=1 Tax=Paracoccus sp. J55 TaxID=935849 RepID=UPI00049099A7|nr:DcaP family trimeric outer membrane transporter [Paracoccus sp. J55]